MTDKKSPQILGTASIGRLLVQYSIPAIIAMTVSSLYHIIDSIFIGQGVGAMAIAGLAVTFPLMNLVIAFCNLVGIGGFDQHIDRCAVRELDGVSLIEDIVEVDLGIGSVDRNLIGKHFPFCVQGGVLGDIPHRNEALARGIDVEHAVSGCKP